LTNQKQITCKHAKSNGKRLRCAGMKHSWTDLFSNDGEYLMCLLPLEVTDHLTFARVGVEGAVAEIEKWGSEFTGIFCFDDFSVNFTFIKVSFTHRCTSK
jgi:hypothetical protein